MSRRAVARLVGVGLVCASVGFFAWMAAVSPISADQRAELVPRLMALAWIAGLAGIAGVLLIAGPMLRRR
jgi:FtsH-binding integral membrane protein